MIKKFKYPFMAFIVGVVLMSVELTATRILAPIIGSSLYTWTSAIGIILLGLTLGSYIGGLLIDKFKKEKVVAIFFILAAILIAFIPFISKWIVNIVFIDISLIYITLIASFILFFTPSLFLGTIYPIILKLYAEELETIGRKTGLLSAMWSLGSIVGTFLTGFYFIEFLGSARTLYFLSLILILTAFLIIKSFKKKLIIVLIIILFFLFNKELFNGEKNKSKSKIFESESSYYKIQVIDNLDSILGNVRILLLDMDIHSMESENKQELGIYTEIYPVFKIFKKNFDKIYIIGGGSYSMAKSFSNEYPMAEIIVSEIDPKVFNVAKDFFNLNEYQIKTIIGDARMSLMKDKTKYDLIFGDAYNSLVSVPWHLTTVEFNDLIKSRLKDGGIYAVNFTSASKGAHSLFFQSMLKTFQLSFPNTYIFVFGGMSFGPQNIVLVGVNSYEKIDISILENKFLSKYRSVQDFSIENGVVLRDDLAPVEKLMLPLINDYFNSYAQIYHQLNKLIF